MSKDKIFDLLLDFNSSPKELKRRIKRAESLVAEAKASAAIRSQSEFLAKVALKIENSAQQYDINNYRVVHYFQARKCEECENSSMEDAGIYFVHRDTKESYLAKDQLSQEVDEIHLLEAKACICYSCRQNLLKARFSEMLFSDPDR